MATLNIPEVPGVVNLLPTATYKERLQSMGVSPRLRIEPDGSSATRIIDVDWAEVEAVSTAILGFPVVMGGSTCWISRNTPIFLPWFRPSDERPYLFASKITDIQGIGLGSPIGTAQYSGDIGVPDGSDSGVSPLGAYEKARITIQYSTFPYDIFSDKQMEKGVAGVLGSGVAGGPITDRNGNPDESWLARYVTKIVRPQAEMLTLNQGVMRYVQPGPVVDPVTGATLPSRVQVVPPNSPVERGVSKLLGSCNVEFTWHQIPENGVPCSMINPLLASNPGSGWIERCLGRVNIHTLYSWRPGTLLLLGVELKPYRSPFGDRLFDIRYMLKYFEPQPGIGHNYIFRALPFSAGPTPGWLEVTTTGSSNILLIPDNGFPLDAYTWGLRNSLANNAPPTQQPGTGSGTAPEVPPISVYDWAPFRNLFRPQQTPAP